MTKQNERDGWAESVEKCWRNRFDEQDSEHTPSTNEMARMLDQYGWYKS